MNDDDRLNETLKETGYIGWWSDELEAARSYNERLINAADRREAQMAEAWDEVERLRGQVDRLQVEKHDLVERLLQMGSDPT